MQLASYNNILVVLILMIVTSSTNYILLRELGFCFGKLKFDYDISSWHLNLIFNPDPRTCNVCIFRFFVMKIYNIFGFWRLTMWCLTF